MELVPLLSSPLAISSLFGIDKTGRYLQESLNFITKIGVPFLSFEVFVYVLIVFNDHVLSLGPFHDFCGYSATDNSLRQVYFC